MMRAAQSLVRSLVRAPLARLGRMAAAITLATAVATCGGDSPMAVAGILVFTGQPGNAVAGASLGNVRVEARDMSGNLVGSFQGTVTLTLASNPGSGTLSGTTSAAAVGGVATFGDLSIDKTGAGYTLRANTTGLQATSNAFTISPAALSALIFTTQPSDVAAGTAIAPAVSVTGQDAFGNVATNFTGTVTMALGANPSGGTLGGPTSVSAVAGMATFAGLTVDKVGTGYTLAASAAGPPAVNATSAAFAVTPGPVARLEFTVQPSTQTAGVAITPPVIVTAYDANDNVAATFTGNVTMAIGTNPAGGVLGGTTTVAAVAGVATFSDLSINRSGTGYTLMVASPGVPSATSAAFDIQTGPPSQLAFTVQPTTAVAGTAITPDVVVEAQDAAGNLVTSFTGTVDIAIASNPGGGTLSGTTSVGASGGAATFSGLSIEKAGVGYTLSASSGSLTPATSAGFEITGGTAVALAFTVEPSQVGAGVPITPAVVVEAQDAFGNADPNFSGDVTITLGANPGGSVLTGTTTVAASAGVATFADLTLDQLANGYTLAASAAGLPGATSAAFEVVAGPATQLVFTIEPTDVGAGAPITPAVVVTALDVGGNIATGFTGDITLAIGTNPAGGALSGATTVAAVGGAATFNDLSIDSAGTGYDLSATSGALTGATSASFDVLPGIAASLVFTVEPSAAVAGDAIAPAVEVTALDAVGNIATSFTGDVTLAIDNNPGSGTLSGTVTVAAVGGVASFADLSIDKAGAGYTLAASAPGLFGATSAAFDIAHGPAAELVFSVQPTDVGAGMAITPAVEVTARDALGNVATDFTGDVTVAIATNPGTGTLSGTTTQPATAGVATFADLSIDKSAVGYTLDAQAAGLTTAVSAAFTVGAGVAVELVFSVEPSTATAGVAITPAVVVTARDALGNTATTFTDDVTIAITTNPAGGTLGGTTTLAAAAGVATFSDLTIDSAGTGYVLGGTATGLTDATSAAFDVIAGPAAQLVFTVDPTSATAGDAIGAEVTALDSQGNVAADFTGDVTLAIGTNPGGGTLSGTSTVAAVAGVASFSGLSIDKAGVGYTLEASSGALTVGTSAAFDITPGAAVQLVFTVQPSAASAGSVIAPPVEVSAQDALGNTDPNFVDDVTIAIDANPGSGVLSGTGTVAAVGGVAVFGDLSIDKLGNGYTFLASTTSLPNATSAAFNIASGPPTQLVVLVQPSTTAAGSSITPAVEVSAQDALGNVDPSFTDNVTVALSANPGMGTLSGTVTVAAVAGVASFTDLSIDSAAVGYTLELTSGALPAVTSDPFDIVPGAVAELAFTVQPVATTAGEVMPAVAVTARDAQGNTVTDFTGDVTLAIDANPGTGTLSGTTTQAAAAGVATFGDLSIDKAGAGYTLAATSTGVPGGTSAGFDITAGPVTQLVFAVAPSTTVAGQLVSPAVEVAAQDALGNTNSTFTADISVAIGTNPANGTLAGTLTAPAAAGVASFADLSIDSAGTGYTLVASSAGLPDVTSATFDIAGGVATKLVFTVEPATAVAGETIVPAVTVAAQDDLGNTDVSFTGDVTLAIGTNPGGGTLSGTVTVAAVNGVAGFGDLSIEKSGVGYTLDATATGLAGASSAAFDIQSGPVAGLAFTVEPTSAQAGAAIAPAVTVAAQDALGNAVTTFTDDITLVIDNNPSGATLLGTATQAAVGGVATFADINVDKVGTGYTLQAGSGALPPVVSAAFDITPGPVSQLTFTTNPSNTTAGGLIPAVAVAAQDAFGNLVPSFTANITIAIGTNPGGGVLSGTNPKAAVGGVATFTNLSINAAGTGYTLTASATGLATGISAAFDILPSVATQLFFTVQPSAGIAGAAITPAIQVSARDFAGQTVTSYTGAVTLSIAAGFGATGATLSGTTTVNAVGGIATFSDISLDRPATNYKLTATAAGLTAATSGFFTINAGPATHLGFVVQPSAVQQNASINPPVEVAALDALGNVATGYAGTVTVAIGTNPSGGALSGVTTVAAVQGIASFPGLSINQAGTGYTLGAVDGGLTGATSAAFNVTAGAPPQLAFSVQPSNATAGATITPAVSVTGPGLTGSVTISITSGTGTNGATLSGTRTVTAVGGTATFNNLSIDKSGFGYRLSVVAAGFAGATSVQFTISNGAAAQLDVSQQPTTTAAGAIITPAVTVRARDAFNNPVSSFAGDVTLAIETNPGSGILSGTKTVAAVGGIATFADLSIDKSGVGYRLIATSAGLDPDVSNAFSITGGAPVALVFSVQPTSTPSASQITPSVRVAAHDAFGNVADGFTGDVTLAIANNPVGGQLFGNATVAASNGVAIFSNLSIDKVGSGYTLAASATGLTGATSTPFDVTAGAGNHLAFTVAPTTTVAGQFITPAVAVSVLDAQGALVSTATGTVTLSISSNPSGGTLSGTTTVSIAGGVATFSNLAINRSGNGYTLFANASGGSGAASVTSAAFNIVPGPAFDVAFAVQPSTAVAGVAIAPAVQVTARDNQGNTATDFTGDVTVAIQTNPGGGILSGTLTVAAVSGVATFADLSIDKAASGYRLSASSLGLAGSNSSTFAITPASASALAFTVEPGNTAAGASITPAVAVTALDPFGNTATSFTGDITVAIANNPGTGVLSGTVTVAAVAGVASFADLSIDQVGTGYTLSATGTGLSGTTSAPFNITAGAAAALFFTTQPGNTTAGANFTPAVVVTARDGQGNTATGFTGNVTIAIGTNPPGNGVLDGTATVAAVGGVATFSTLNIDEAGTGYTLVATGGGLTQATSNAFNITAGGAAQLAFTTQPSSTAAGATITPAPVVEAQDAFGNLVSSFVGNVTVAIGTNPPGTGVLDGTVTVQAVGGVAEFSALDIDEAGTGYTLTANGGGLTEATSDPFTISAGAATQLVFTVPPANTAAAQTMAAVAVAAQDGLGNTDPSFTGQVTVAIQNNAGGGTLSGTVMVAAVNGVATFSDLSIDKVGTAYTLSATGGALTAATSPAFDITAGGAATLHFTQEPTSATAGAAITPSIVVTARDGGGNTATGFTGDVTVAIDNNAGGGTLSGTATVAAVNGVATFAGLSIDKAGTGYTLGATASGLTGATSAAFDITAGAATQMTIDGGDGQSATVNTAVTTPPSVLVRDQFDNPVAGVAVTFSVASGGGSVTGENAVTDANGIATIGSWTLGTTAGGNTLDADALSLSTVTFTATGTADVAAALVFTVPPATTTAGATLAAVEVTAQDVHGNTVTDFTDGVSIAIENNAGPGAVLTGTSPVSAVAGVATFSDLSINLTGPGYTLRATSGSLTVVSSAFDIN